MAEKISYTECDRKNSKQWNNSLMDHQPTTSGSLAPAVVYDESEAELLSQYTRGRGSADGHVEHYFLRELRLIMYGFGGEVQPYQETVSD